MCLKLYLWVVIYGNESRAAAVCVLWKTLWDLRNIFKPYFMLIMSVSLCVRLSTQQAIRQQQCLVDTY